MKKCKAKKRIRIFAFLLATVLLACYLYFSSNKILENLALKSFDSLISSASYYAIDEIVSKGYDYKSLIDVSKDKNGDVNMVVTNSLKINELASIVATETYNYLDRYTKLGVDVPVFAFTGIKLISGLGKAIKMQLISVSTVKSEIVSSFTEAGINQTRHTLTLNIFSTVSLITKTSAQTVSDKISILIFDNLIIGKVPEIYLNSKVVGSANKN